MQNRPGRRLRNGRPEAPKGIAIQLYTVRDPAKKDLAGTLKKLRAMGWENVQWSGMPNLPFDKIQSALDAAQLRAISAHVTIDSLEKDFDETVRGWKAMGVEHLAIGTMMADCKADLEGWLRGAKRLAAVGAKLREEGIRFAYHNHNFEFSKFPGDPRRKIDILLESTPATDLKAEFDVAWVHIGGADPADYLRKYKGRVPAIHVKDHVPMKKGGKVQFTPLGQGAELQGSLRRRARGGRPMVHLRTGQRRRLALRLGSPESGLHGREPVIRDSQSLRCVSWEERGLFRWPPAWCPRRWSAAARLPKESASKAPTR